MQNAIARSILLVIVVTPLFLGEVVRTYSWIIVLGNNGFINSVLRDLGIIQAPIQFMFTTFGVVVALTLRGRWIEERDRHLLSFLDHHLYCAMQRTRLGETEVHDHSYDQNRRPENAQKDNQHDRECDPGYIRVRSDAGVIG